MSEPKTFPHDDKFPANVNPTEENRRKFSEEFGKAQKAAEKGESTDDVRFLGEGRVEDVNLIEDTAAPKRQSKTAAKD